MIALAMSATGPIRVTVCLVRLACELLPQREVAMAYAEIPVFLGRCVLVLSAYALACWLGVTL